MSDYPDDQYHADYLSRIHNLERDLADSEKRVAALLAAARDVGIGIVERADIPGSFAASNVRALAAEAALAEVSKERDEWKECLTEATKHAQGTQWVSGLMN